jgi:UDP-4-amino-4,6-dideoxy-N-acetyl-beta-L-altrosamine transaminase
MGYLQRVQMISFLPTISSSVLLMISIPHQQKTISDEDALAVIEALRSGYLVEGPAIEAFENAVAQYCGAKYAVAVSSATAALHMACLAAGVGPGRSLWTSPNAFVTSANCARYCYGEVDFVDIDPLSFNLDAAKLEQKLGDAELQGRLPQAVLPVHFAGQSCEMEKIYQLCQHFGTLVIEDASHALGGYYRGAKVGCGQYSDMTVFSFDPSAIVTSGEGGMVLTNRHDLYQKLLRLRSHGVAHQPESMRSLSQGEWVAEQVELGFNYRMTEVQAALGASQMARVDSFVQRRHEIAADYDAALKALPLTTPWRHPDAFSACSLYTIELNDAAKRQLVYGKLREAGIDVGVHFMPLHWHPYYRKSGFRVGDFPIAESHYQRTLSLPILPVLQAEEQQHVIEVLTAALSI